MNTLFVDTYGEARNNIVVAHFSVARSAGAAGRNIYNPYKNC
jgi:hypothetical protein